MKEKQLLEQGQLELQALLTEFQKKEQELLDKYTKEQREQLGHPLKDVYHLDTFKANGKKYIVRTSLTVERFEEFERLQVHVGYGIDFRTMFDNVRKSYDYMNAGKMADASVVLYNIMNGIKDKLEDRENEVLLICALFICTENENLATYDPALTTEKIADWKAEGITMESFFDLAFSLVNGFMPAYKEASRNILGEVQEVRKSIKKKKK